MVFVDGMKQAEFGTEASSRRLAFVLYLMTSLEPFRTNVTRHTQVSGVRAFYGKQSPFSSILGLHPQEKGYDKQNKRMAPMIHQRQPRLHRIYQHCARERHECIKN